MPVKFNTASFLEMCRPETYKTLDDGHYQITDSFSVQMMSEGQELCFKYRFLIKKRKVFNVFLTKKNGIWVEGKVFRTYH